MAIAVLVHVKVEDYDRWRRVFEANAEMRKQAGSLGSHIFRNAKEPNELFVNMQMESSEQAEQFLASQELRDGMQEAGVIGQPEFWYLDDGGRTPS